MEVTPQPEAKKATGDAESGSSPRLRIANAGARNFRGWPLKAYFALLVGMFVLAAAGAAGYVFVQSARDGRADAERDAAFTATTAAGQLGDAIAALRAHVGNVAATPQIELALAHPEACTLAFSGPGGLGSGHVDILRSDGTVACSSRSAKGDQPLPGYGGADWLARANDGKRFEAPVPEPATGGHAAIATAPIAGGIVAAFLDLEPAGPGLLRLYGGGRPVELLVTSGDGRTVLIRSIDPKRWVGAAIAGSDFSATSDAVERRDLDGRTRLYASAPVPGLDWRFLVGEDEQAALAASGRLRERQLGIIAAGLLLVLLAALAVYRKVAVPVTRLSAAVRATSELVPPEPVPVGGPAEVSTLGHDVNALIASVGRELADRKRAEESARASERNYRLLFESSPIPMWIHDVETGAILEVNDAALDSYGYSREEFLALTMDDVDPHWERALVRGGSFKRVRHRHRDGTGLEISTIAHDVSFGERPARFVLAEDVGERERLEGQLRQAQRLEAIGRLAGGIAHDFNNLLTAVLGYSDVMLEHIEPGDPHRRETEEIKKAGERAVALTRQLLTLGRGQEVEPVVLDLNEVVGEIEPMLRRLIRADVEIETRLDPAAGRIRADLGQIQQVLVNLAVNAGDAMPEGGRLTVATTHTELDEHYFELHPVAKGAPGHYAMLEVADTGIGIDDETMAHLFEPFFTTKSAEEGTGLGLATVYGIIRQSGGFIWAYSELGRGTTFKVYLPFVEAAVEPGSTPARERLFPAAGRTVLLVEDDLPVRAVVRRMLEAHGFTILEAGEGNEALAVSDQADPGSLDLLLTDTVIPGPGGLGLADRIRVRHTTVRTLVMSGYSDAMSGADFVLPPGTEFIAKPFSAADLNRKLKALLGLSAAGR